MDEQAPGLTDHLRDDALITGAGQGFQKTTVEEERDLRFFELVRQVALNSFDVCQPGQNAGLAVFVMADRPREASAEFLGAAHLPDLDLNRPDRWLGHLVIAADHVRSGFAVPIENDDLDGTLAKVAGSLLAHAPLAVVYPVQRVLSCYRGGAQDGYNLRFPLLENGHELTLNELLTALEDYRKNSLLTPSICPPNLWKTAADYQPGENVEKEIQWGLVIQLRSLFRPIKVEPEQNSPVGRIDIPMTDPNPRRNGSLHPATLELKALRSKRPGGATISPSEMIQHVADGHHQAAAYRADKDAPVGILACYDMREHKDDILAHPTVTQARLSYFNQQMHAVILKLYGKAADAQIEIAAAAL